jgi:hypothetical protein
MPSPSNVGQPAKKPAPKAPAPKAPAPPDGNFFAGMDTHTFPGELAMRSLFINTNVTWTGFYLTPAPSQGHNLKWMGKAGFLRAMGMGIAPIYVGRQIKSVPRTDHRMTPANGTIDGKHAGDLAISAGLSGSVVFLDFENPAPLLPEQKTYYAAWAAGLRLKGCKPGVYCIASIAAGLQTVVPGGSVWVANYTRFPKTGHRNPFPKPDPALGATGATQWQLQGDTVVAYEELGGKTKHIKIDLNSSVVKDPSGLT